MAIFLYIFGDNFESKDHYFTENYEYKQVLIL